MPQVYLRRELYDNIVKAGGDPGAVTNTAVEEYIERHKKDKKGGK